MKTIFESKPQNFISVIVPVLNEVKNVKILNRFLKIALRSHRYKFEIIYIDDHSTDGTYEYLTKIADFKEVFVYKKQGRRGKSFSLVEGFSYARGDILAMIDADLQYPVTALIDMIKLIRSGSDVVVANRKKIQTSFIRKIASKGFKNLFGKILFGLQTDIQSGLKVFTKRAYEAVFFQPQTPWTFDLEFLYRVNSAGFIISDFDITFGARQNGNSKVSFIRQTLEIGSNALMVRAKKLNPVIIPPKKEGSMIGAGVGHKKRQFITHTTLPLHKTAFHTFITHQIIIMSSLLLMLAAGLFLDALLAVQILLTIVSVVYFTDTIFNFFVIWRSLTRNVELRVTSSQLNNINDHTLPVYSILCPLYKESKILPQFLDAINKLNWPKEKLEVLLLLEEDDRETIKAINKMRLPSYIRPVIVPYSEPKTKPKACNYGLNLAKGEYIVIYDAEDIPEPNQLKIAYYSFKKSDEKMVCLQAKLNYYNPKQNLLTRFFTAEYSLWFDLTLPGFQSLNTSLPLGGTSNHFKTDLLLKLQGWDTFNVTEDADLGIRLFKEGYKSAIIDSTTLEEANSDLHNWVRQRSRWIKGYLQSYLVHTRDIIRYSKENRLHAFYMQLIIGTKLIFIFLNPLLWVTTISYFLFYKYVGQTIEALYLPPAFYLGTVSLVFGNFLFFYYYMIGIAKKGQWELMKSTIFIPIYWIFISIAGWIAVYQLIVKPYYWEKTIHGLHLVKKKGEIDEEIETEDEVYEIPIVKQPRRFIPVSYVLQFVAEFVDTYKTHIASGKFLWMAKAGAHVLNLLFNILLFRDVNVPLQAVSVISLLSSFLYLISIPMNALEEASIYRIAVVGKKYGIYAAYEFWGNLRRRLTVLSMILTIIWVLLSPMMRYFFRLDSIWSFILFAPVLIVALGYAVDRGYLRGRLHFGRIGLLMILEPLLKIGIAFGLISLSALDLVYSSIPYSFVIIYFLGIFLMFRVPKAKQTNIRKDITSFPGSFFAVSFISHFTNIAFLSLDILLAKHFLSPVDAGKYALISLVGKMVYLLGGLTWPLVFPLFSKYRDKKAESRKILSLSVLSTAALAGIGVIFLGLLSNISLPVLLGSRAEIILPYALPFAASASCFAVARVFTMYYTARNQYASQMLSILMVFVQIALISTSHESLIQFIQMMSFIGFIYLGFVLFLHINSGFIGTIEESIKRLVKSVRRIDSQRKLPDRRPAILIFNWRDIKHAWAGGAEVYVHEIAKRWVKQGLNVTVFSGFDNKSAMDDVKDGVKMIRRGGKYTVYFWAFVYYIFVLRKKHDVIVDCENGIPFFTPFYSNKPVFLLIYHVHQDVFKQYLPWPIAKTAAFLESKLMPYVYRSKQIITISESSKKAILKLGHFKSENIQIIHCGIDSKNFNPQPKTIYPSFIYLGRLKFHKNIDVAVKAFGRILNHYPKAVLNIVGEGEDESRLRSLVKSLNITNSVNFYGRVTESVKYKLLSESWVMLQPSGVEGWGITVIEANGSGTPVIASDVSGLRDSVVNNETGLLVEVRNVKQLGLAMDYILSNKLKRELYIKNALVWSKNFTWDKSADMFLGIISEALSPVVISGDYQGILALNKTS